MLLRASLNALFGFLLLNRTVFASNVAQVSHEAAVMTGNPKTMINLINGTPYDWVLKDIHEYQMRCK